MKDPVHQGLGRSTPKHIIRPGGFGPPLPPKGNLRLCRPIQYDETGHIFSEGFVPSPVSYSS
jgi:hypothetical protein